MFESAATPTIDRAARRSEIEREIAAVQADVNAGQARLTSLVEEHARHEDWRVHDGIRSEAGFLGWRTGVVPGEASSLVTAAEGLRELPRVRAAFLAGRLSLGQVRALVGVATRKDEPELLRLALGMTGAQLARFCAYYRSILRVEQGRHRARRLRTSYTSDGMWHISGTMAAEEGAVVDRAIRAAVEALRREERESGGAAEASPEDADTADGHHDGADDPEDPFAAEAADALVRVAESFLDGDAERSKDPDRHVVVIHVDAEALASEDGKATIEGGGEIPAEAAARIACRAPVMALLERDGRPLAVGRKTRRTGRALRRALLARDRQCRFPGCHRRAVVRLDAHHIEHWGRGGETSPENLLILCRSHHIAVHERGLRIEHTVGGGYLFRRPDGTVIRRPEIQARSPGIGHRNRAQGIEVIPDTCAPEWGGERGSIRYVVDVFASRASPGGPAP